MASGAGALSYVDETNVQFTFNPMLTMTLSEGDLTITDLAPGNSKNSNAVAITVNTNSVYGYGLYATVGNSTYNSTDLVLSGGADSFTSIATNANASSLSGGYWGYSIDAGTTYNGLPLYTATNGAELKTTTGAAQNDATSFLIGAAADTAQTQGTYNNVINFSAVARMYDELSIEAMDTMQNLGSLSTAGKTAVKSTMVAGQPYTLQDSRDGQDYTVAKLADGKVWMTQNLKLGKTTTTMSLTTADSDVSSSGFTLNNKLSDGKFPRASSTSSTDAYYQYDGSAYYCTDAYGCYYNWYTATASSGTGSTTSGNVNYSICPAGWTLPTGGSGGEFEALSTAYGGTGSVAATAMLVPNPTTTTENVNGASAPGLLLGGYYYASGANYVGSDGNYWSRTAYSARYGYSLSLSTSSVSPTSSYLKYLGLSVRCVLAE